MNIFDQIFTFCLLQLTSSYSHDNLACLASIKPNSKIASTYCANLTSVGFYSSLSIELTSFQESAWTLVKSVTGVIITIACFSSLSFIDILPAAFNVFKSESAFIGSRFTIQWFSLKFQLLWLYFWITLSSVFYQLAPHFCIILSVAYSLLVFSLPSCG